MLHSMFFCFLSADTKQQACLAAQREEEDAKKLYDEFVTSFGDEPEQKGSQRSFKRGGVIQPGSSASSTG